MAQATDQQMQQYANERIRVRAEQTRALLNSFTDDQQAIPDVWDRAANGDPWTDNRTDGPPKLLTSNDVLVHNLVSGIVLKCFAGTATLDDIAALAANKTAYLSACVRPVGA